MVEQQDLPTSKAPLAKRVGRALKHFPHLSQEVMNWSVANPEEDLHAKVKGIPIAFYSANLAEAYSSSAFA